MATLGKINLRNGFSAASDTYGSWTDLNGLAISTTVNILNFADGVDTGWDVTITDAPASHGGGGVSAVGTGDAAWVDEAVVSETYHSIQRFGNDEAEYSITGLDNGKTYNVSVFTSRNATGRKADFSVDGFSSSVNVDAAYNSTLIAEFTNVSPSSGTIAMGALVDATNDWGYINAIQIEEVDGGSSGIEILRRRIEGY